MCAWERLREKEGGRHMRLEKSEWGLLGPGNEFDL